METVLPATHIVIYLFIFIMFYIMCKLCSRIEMLEDKVEQLEESNDILSLNHKALINHVNVNISNITELKSCQLSLDNKLNNLEAIKKDLEGLDVKQRRDNKSIEKILKILGVENPNTVWALLEGDEFALPTIQDELYLIKKYLGIGVHIVHTHPEIVKIKKQSKKSKKNNKEKSK